MSADFVKLMADAEGRSLTMIAPLDRAWDALYALAVELPPTFTYSARLVDSLDLRAEATS